MKKLIPAIALIFFGAFSKAQSIPIQLMVVDQNGFEMPNTQVKLRLTMRGDTSSTTGQYQEVHNVSTNDLGVLSVDLGEGIVTTNSQVLAIELFSFGLDEPYIKTELDTSISPANYTNLGWMKYRYPLVARRALWADSTITAINALGSYHSLKSDSASYLINEKPEWLLDSSLTNELQTLSFDNKTFELSLSDGNSVDLSSLSSAIPSSLQLKDVHGHSSITYKPWQEYYNDTVYGVTYDGAGYISAPISNLNSVDTVLFSNFIVLDIHPADSVVIGTNSTWTTFFIKDLSGNTIFSQSVSGISQYYASAYWFSYRNKMVSFRVRTAYSTYVYYTWNYVTNVLTSNSTISGTSSLSTLTSYSSSPAIVYDRFTFTPLYTQSWNSWADKITRSHYSPESGIGIKSTNYSGDYYFHPFTSDGSQVYGQVNLNTVAPFFEVEGSVFFNWINSSESGLGYIDLRPSDDVIKYVSLSSGHRTCIDCTFGTIQAIRGEGDKVLMIIYDAVNFPIGDVKLSGTLVFEVQT